MTRYTTAHNEKFANNALELPLDSRGRTFGLEQVLADPSFQRRLGGVAHVAATLELTKKPVDFQLMDDGGVQLAMPGREPFSLK